MKNFVNGLIAEKVQQINVCLKVEKVAGYSRGCMICRLELESYSMSKLRKIFQK